MINPNAENANARQHFATAATSLTELYKLSSQSYVRGAKDSRDGVRRYVLEAVAASQRAGAGQATYIDAGALLYFLDEVLLQQAEAGQGAFNRRRERNEPPADTALSSPPFHRGRRTR